MIEPRKFNTIVEIIQTFVGSDGFGGQTQELQTLGNVFARVETGGTVRNENGQKVFDFDYIVYIRERNLNPKNQLIRYKGRNYVIEKFEYNQLNTQIKLWLTLQV